MPFKDNKLEALVKELCPEYEEMEKENIELKLKLEHISGLYKQSLFNFSELKNEHIQGSVFTAKIFYVQDMTRFGSFFVAIQKQDL